MTDDLAKEINGLMLETDQLHAKALQLYLKMKRLKRSRTLRDNMDQVAVYLGCACRNAERVVEELIDAEEIAREEATS